MKKSTIQSTGIALLTASCTLLWHASPVNAQAPEDPQVPSIIEEDCASDFGECAVWATEPNADGAFTSLASECTCASGEGWASEMLATPGQPFDANLGKNLCQEALANCKPPLVPGPPETQVFPTQDVHIQDMECNDEGWNQDEDASCSVHKGPQGLELHCECGETSHGFSVPRADPISQNHLHRICVQEIAVCKSNAKGGSGGSDDVEGTLEALGCELSGQTPTTPISFGLSLLLLGGLVRRKRNARI